MITATTDLVLTNHETEQLIASFAGRPLRVEPIATGFTVTGTQLSTLEWWVDLVTTHGSVFADDVLSHMDYDKAEGPMAGERVYTFRGVIAARAVRSDG